MLTKTDKTKAEALRSVRESVEGELAGHLAAHPEVLATSALKGEGIAALRASLAALAEARPLA